MGIESNTYGALEDLKTFMGGGLGTDAALLRVHDAASREVDDVAGRHFFVETAIRFYDTFFSNALTLPDDLLVVTAFGADNDLDGTYGEVWVENTDYRLHPANSFPKWEAFITPDGTKIFNSRSRRYVKITGTWGYGDGRNRASPVDPQGGVYTVANASGLVFTTVSGTDPKVGETLLIDEEQVFVESFIAGTSFTCPRRGENGTTAASHTTAAASVYRYPSTIVQVTFNLARDLWNARGQGFLESERIGDYAYKRGMTPKAAVEMALGPYTRVWIA